MPPEAAPPPMLDAAVTFGRVLRRMGLPAGPDRVVEFVRAVEELDVTRRDDVYWAGKITMCSNPGHLEVYDRAFQSGQVGSAAAIGISLTLVIFLISFAINRVAERGGSR